MLAHNRQPQEWPAMTMGSSSPAPSLQAGLSRGRQGGPSSSSGTGRMGHHRNPPHRRHARGPRRPLTEAAMLAKLIVDWSGPAGFCSPPPSWSSPSSPFSARPSTPCRISPTCRVIVCLPSSPARRRRVVEDRVCLSAHHLSMLSVPRSKVVRGFSSARPSCDLRGRHRHLLLGQRSGREYLNPYRRRCKGVPQIGPGRYRWAESARIRAARAGQETLAELRSIRTGICAHQLAKAPGVAGGVGELLH